MDQMSPKILVVVQDAFFRQALADKLRQLGFFVMLSESTHSTLEILDYTDVEVVLVDIRDMKEQALQTVTNVKQIRTDAEVILLSSTECIDISMACMREGASDDIIVPFDMETLEQKINDAVERRHSLLLAKNKRNRFLKVFEDVMFAATFAQAGEFDTAREIFSEKKKKKDNNKKKRRGGSSK